MLQTDNDTQSTGMFADPVVRRMAWVGALVLLVFLITVVSALFFGILNPPAPRTAVERELALAEAKIDAESLAPEDWYAYITALVSSGQYGKAERMIETARVGGFEDPAKQYLGVAQVQLDLARGRWEDALSHSEAAMRALEEQLEVEKARYEETGKPTTMIAEGLGRNNDALHLNRAEAFEKLGRTDEAIAELDAYLENNERAADILAWRGDLKADAGDTASAIDDYRSALEYTPGDAELLSRLENLGADR